MDVGKAVSLCVLTVLFTISTAAIADITEERKVRAIELLAENDIEHEGIYVLTRFVPYKQGGGLVSVQQLHQGLLVFDSELVFHFDENDEVIRATDDSANLMGAAQYLGDLIVDPDDLISAQQASDIFSGETKEITIPAMTGQGPGTKVAGPKCTQNAETIELELGIYKQKAAWRAKCSKRRKPLMYIDAVDGSVLSFDSGVRS